MATNQHQKAIKIYSQSKQSQLPTASTLPREYSPRLFKRRQEFSKGKQMQSPQRKRKDINLNQKDAMCYISMVSMRRNKTKESSLEKRRQQKKSQSKRQSVHKQQRSSSSPQLNSIEEQAIARNQKNPQRLNMQSNGVIAKQKKMLDRQTIEITELRQINKILSNQITLLKSNKQVHMRITQDLQDKIAQLSQQLKQSTKKMKFYERETENLKNIINENRINVQYKAKAQEHKEDLQKIIFDINRQIDQIFVEEVSVDMHHSPPKIEDSFHGELLINEELHKKDLREMVYELQSKIKYLEIEVAMLKKYKLDYERMEKEWMISSNQLKTFKKKLILLAQQTQVQNNCVSMRKFGNRQVSEVLSDSSISLQISNDSNIQKF